MSCQQAQNHSSRADPIKTEVMTSSPLKLHFLPYLAPGHLIPLTEVARLFANQGHNVTIITTPANAALLEKYTTTNLSLHLVELPLKEVGLPDGLENQISVNDIGTAAKLYKAMTLMQPHIEEFIMSNPPDCIVSDIFHPWTADLAIKIRIPRLVFLARCIFAMCLQESLRGPDSPHRLLESNYEEFELVGLPDKVVMTRAQLPDYARTPTRYTQLMEMFREAEKKSYGVLVNNFYELDPAYTDLYSKLMGHKVWNIGPAGPILHRNPADKAERVYKAAVGHSECMSWLDTKKPKSVLFVCFGSAIRFPNKQLHEIACALESSKAQFIWAVQGKDEEVSVKDTREWLPNGFEKRIKDSGKGLIIRGWAPQVLILDHPAVGVFMTHCGWNSVIEGVSAGVSMVAWPLYAEHFYNAKLISQVLKIGVEVGVDEWCLSFDEGRKVVKRENIENAIEKLMDGGEEEIEMKRRAKELGEKARNAVEDGGSSHRNLIALIEDLKRIREERTCY